MKIVRLATAAALVAALIVSAAEVSAAPKKKAKKLTYEEAWKRCTAEINKQAVPYDWASMRMSAGAACMKKYGHNI
jgi:hypothetical protein